MIKSIRYNKLSLEFGSFRLRFLSLCIAFCLSVTDSFGEDKTPTENLAKGKLTDVLAPPKNPGDASNNSTGTDIDIPVGDWTVRFLEKNPSPKPSLLSSKSGLKILTDLKITGGGIGNPHLLGEFNAESSWYVQDGYLLPVDKQDSALRIGRVEDFELQGIWNVEGRGGWFILLGFEGGHGYVLENTTFISSGSPWHMTELRGNRGIQDSFHEVSRYEWKGDQKVRLSVEDKKLNLKVGDQNLLEDVMLDNYGPGELIVGTFRGRYAPKPLKIRSLRIRSLKSSPKPAEESN
ncbi:MAG: hypothetical protein KDA65_04730 [Planctomycetaceae bacterium]|nr:hypothetical protein [Planctomycetaceae bacterium]